jgi:hypothetical protein
MCREVYLTPGCCKAMRESRVIHCSTYTDNMGDCCYDGEPHWSRSFSISEDVTIRYQGNRDEQERLFAVKFCPFCGKAVPEFEKNPKPPQPLCKVTDGGYRCDTCGKRLNECKCFSPDFIWRVKR